MNKIEEIHESLANGQRRQMVDQIDEYGLYEAFDHYERWLAENYGAYSDRLFWFRDAVVSYFHIKYR